MYCENCGAKLPDDSAFCDHCGARLEPSVNEPMPQESEAFTWTRTMVDAARVAESQNPSGEWSYWDSPGSLTETPRRLMRFAQKEDKRLSDMEGLYYLVSRAGSVGHLYKDEEEGGFVLEWVFFAPGEDAESLPASPDEL